MSKKCLITLLMMFLLAGNLFADDLSKDRVVVTPQDTGAALVNPMMGWTMHFYSNVPTNYGSKLAPSDTLDDFPGLSTVYLRVPWSFIEPEEGRFNWALLDTPAQRWIDKGKYVAFRITCSENWTQYATPKWVKDAGAKGSHYIFNEGPCDDESRPWDPDYEDPIYREKLENFLREMGRRYNGNPNVAFIDVGTFGMWGEAHTMMSVPVVPREKNLNVVKWHIDMHKKYFPDTLLCISDDAAGHNTPGTNLPETDYAFSQGVSLRDDSIMVQPPPNSWFHSELAQQFWPTLPVILEHEHYGSSKNRNAWSADLMKKAIEDYHASFMSIHWWPRIELEENRELINEVNRRLGYRLQLRRISWPREIKIGQWFELESEWANAGVSPCYPGGYMALTLKDAEGGIVSVITEQNFDMRTLQPTAVGETQPQSFSMPAIIGMVAPVVLPGEYDVFVSVGMLDGTPKIALPLPNDDGHRRYKIGTITVVQ